MHFDMQPVMQTAHGAKLHIDQQIHRPAVFQEMVKEESSLPWEAKAFDRLELPCTSGYTLDCKLSTV
jgi:hypothetical protein